MKDNYGTLIGRLAKLCEEAQRNDYLVETQHRIARSGKFVELD